MSSTVNTRIITLHQSRFWAVGALVLFLTCGERPEPAAVISNQLCDFSAVNRDGRLVSFDVRTGAIIGVFERWPHGAIQLTTPGGYAPEMTGCLRTQGLGNQLASIALHKGPSAGDSTINGRADGAQVFSINPPDSVGLTPLFAILRNESDLPFFV